MVNLTTMRKAILVSVLLAAACSSPAAIPDTTITVPETTTTKPSTTSLAPSQDAQPATFAGTFTVANTTAGGNEVGVNAIELEVRVSTGTDGNWRTLAAACTTDPATPFVVAERQAVAFTCHTSEVLAAGTGYEVAGSVDLFGTDAPYEFVETGFVGQG